MPLILGTNSIKDTGYDVDNSLRYNQNDDCLIKTFGSGGNRKKFTFSLWIKLSGRGTGNNNGLLVAGTSGNDEGTIKFSNDVIDWVEYDSGTASVIGRLTTSQVFRDYSAWSHLVFVWDSGNATAGNRMRIYHNGSEITSFSDDTNPSLNYDAQINNNVLHNIGRQSWNNSGDYNGYMAEVCFIDSQALDPTSFGEFDEDSGIWKPIDVSGLTFGTNGFYLDFENSGSLGADVSGNGNNFTVNNLTAIDQSISTPTNIFATWNPLASSSQATLSEGNLKAVGNSTDDGNVFCNMVPKSGKWYAEFKITKSNDGIPTVGIRQESSGFRLLNGTSGAVGYYQYEASVRPDGQRYTNNSTVSWGGSTFVTGSIIGIALDCDNGAGYISVNGTYMNSGDPTSGGSKTGAFITWTEAQAQYGGQTFASRIYTTSSGIEANFGSPPYSESGGNSDGNGYGNFSMAVPSGYYSLNSKNLAEYG